MSSLFSFVFFMLFMLLFISVGMIATSQFIEHLKKNHSDRFKSMTGKSFLGISSDDLWTPPINPFVFLKFLFSSDFYDDNILKKHKTRIRILLSSYIVLSLFAAILID